jgi:hypothetical protein
MQPTQLQTSMLLHPSADKQLIVLSCCCCCCMCVCAAAACSGAQVRKAVELTATNKGKWNNETGWGMPQALDAHAYLLGNPCSTSGGDKATVSYTVVRNGSKDGKPRIGSSLRITATLTSAGKPLFGKVVTIVIDKPWMLFACKANSNCKGSFMGRTNAHGAYSVNGKVQVKGGNGVVVTVWATASGAGGAVTAQKVSIPITR